MKNFNLKWVYSFYTINPLYFNWSDFFYLDLNINNICLFGSIIFFYNIGVLKNKFLIKKNIYNNMVLYNPIPYYYQGSHMNVKFRDYLVFFIPAAVYLEDTAVYYCIN